MSFGDIHTISFLSGPSLKNIPKRNCKILILGGFPHMEGYFCFLQHDVGIRVEARQRRQNKPDHVRICNTFNKKGNRYLVYKIN